MPNLANPFYAASRPATARILRLLLFQEELDARGRIAPHGGHLNATARAPVPDRETPLSPSDSSPGLVLQFGSTSSPNRDAAIRIARSFRRYQKRGDGRGASHVCPVSLRSDREWKAALQLLRMISGWKSTSIRIDGVPTGLGG